MAKKSTLRKQNTTSQSAPSLSLGWFDILEQRLAFTFSPAIVAFGVNAILFALMYTFFKPEFNTGDDKAMMLLAAGKLIALEPTEYLIFINILLGHLLKGLYTIFPHISWYPLLLITGLFAGYTAMLYAILKRRANYGVVALYASAFAIIGGYMLLELQFTMTATVLGFGGIALLLLPVEKAEMDTPLLRIFLNRLQSIPAWLGMALLVLAAMVRWQSFLLVLACVVPLFVVGLLFRQERLSRIISCGLLTLASLLALSAEGYHQYRYAHWGNFNYLEFNRLYGEFFDFKRFLRVPWHEDIIYERLKTSAGWSPIDYEMFQNECYFSDSVYTIEAMQRLLESHDQYQRDASFNPASAYYDGTQTFIKEQRQQLWQRQKTTLLSDGCLCALAFCLVCILFSQMEIATMISVIAVLGAIFGVLFYVNYLTLMRDAAERVFFPLWIYLALLPLLVMRPLKNTSNQRHHAFVRNVLGSVAALLCLFAVGYGSRTIFGQYQGITSEIQGAEGRLQTVVAKLAPQKENLYVIWAYGFPFKELSPFCDLRVFDNFHALWLAWMQKTPTSHQMLQAHGIGDFYRDIVSKPSLFFLLSANQLFNQLLRYPLLLSLYLYQHYDIGLTSEEKSIKFLMGDVQTMQTNPGATFLSIRFKSLPLTPAARNSMKELNP
ncbi:MAG: hypothetical protein ACOVSW_18555 [Candidatus Kapaibacteriota bacterium]